MFFDSDEYQYLNLIKNILKNGNDKDDRTGIGTLSIFGAQMRFSLANNTFPLLTTREIFTRGIIEELLWFIKGSTNANELKQKNINIWNANSSRSFLDSVGLKDRDEGDLGPIYGFQWRHFGAKYIDMYTDYTNKGIDQLKEVIEKIKTSPNDRRMIICSWNAMDISKVALPPCHCLVQFYVNNKKLSCQVYQRSADMGLGIPFNIASYSLLTIMIAHITNLEPGEFIHSLGDAHIYKNHILELKTQLERKPKQFPKLTIKRTISEIEDFKYEDFDISNYDPHPKINMIMAV